MAGATANSSAVSEFTFALVLGLCRMIPVVDASMRAGAWTPEPFIGAELEGRTLGLVGLGNIGARVARHARGFGMRVLASDPEISEQDAAERGAILVAFDALLRESDVISLHPRLTVTTRHLIDEMSIEKMKPGVRIVNTSRGCPYNCTFCSVKPFWGAKIRFRPIDHVVRDVDAVPGRMYINGDENIWWTGKADRAIELFTALRGSRKKWMGFGSLGPVLSPVGPRMLNAARESGLLSLWVGWDSLSDEGLRAYAANAKIGDDRERAVKTLKDHGIDGSLFYMLGSREDSVDDFKRSIELADRLGVSMHPSLVVPYPGTKLREQYEPYIYKELGWVYYTGAYALFEHPDPAMTPEVREERFYESSLDLLSLRRVLRHMLKVPRAGFPDAHILSLMSQIPVRHGMKIAYEKWKVDRQSVAAKRSVL